MKYDREITALRERVEALEARLNRLAMATASQSPDCTIEALLDQFERKRSSLTPADRHKVLSSIAE